MDRQPIHQALSILRDVQPRQRSKAIGQMLGKDMQATIERIFLRNGNHCLLAHNTA